MSDVKVDEAALEAAANALVNVAVRRAGVPPVTNALAMFKGKVRTDFLADTAEIVTAYLATARTPDSTLTAEVERLREALTPFAECEVLSRTSYGLGIFGVENQDRAFRSTLLTAPAKPSQEPPMPSEEIPQDVRSLAAGVYEDWLADNGKRYTTVRAAIEAGIMADRASRQSSLPADGVDVPTIWPPLDTGDDFHPGDFAAVAERMTAYADQEANLKAVLSNNYNIILAALKRAALSAQPAPRTAEGEPVWLIERNGFAGDPRPHWYWEDSRGHHAWTPEAGAALPFKTKAEAESFPAYRMISRDPDITITEHVFVAAPPANPALIEQAIEALQGAEGWIEAGVAQIAPLSADAAVPGRAMIAKIQAAIAALNSLREAHHG